MIDKGSNDGILIDSGVINSSGIIGIINNVSSDYSSVISILNTDLNSNLKINLKLNVHPYVCNLIC